MVQRQDEGWVFAGGRGSDPPLIHVTFLGADLTLPCRKGSSVGSRVPQLTAELSCRALSEGAVLALMEFFLR